MKNNNNNPCHLDGFAFLEFSGPNKNDLEQQFNKMGFRKIAIHKNQEISLYQQGTILFIVNAAIDCQAQEHAAIHGTGACAMGFKVLDAQEAFAYAINHGAQAFTDCQHAHHNLFGIKAIGGSVIYFVDQNHKPFAQHWHMLENANLALTTIDCGLASIDHLTHNVQRGNMDIWARFYEKIFNFHEIRYFDIKGKMTGLISRALTSPCGKIKIPLNESQDDQSQIAEFLEEYHGEGIQHIALATTNIYKTVAALRKQGVSFLDVPDTYYEMINARVPWHQESLKELQAGRILLDGGQDANLGLLLQIFTENVFGPVFFEIIERRGNQGFGEGNFQALFEAIERDQVKRGILIQ